MLVGITALVIFLTVILFHSLPALGKMWPPAISILGIKPTAITLISSPTEKNGNEDDDDARSDRSTTPTPENQKVEKPQVEVPSIQVAAANVPTFSFAQNEDLDDDDDDAPAMFPAMNSAQRASGGISSIRAPPTLSSLPTNSTKQPAPPASSASSLRMPPPSIPTRNLNAAAAARSPIRLSAPILSPPPGGLGPPSSIFNVPRSQLALPPASIQKLAKPRKKVILTPGHSPLDWARIQSTPSIDLRDLPHPHLLKVTPSELAKHNTKESCWVVLEDKVYNATRYLPFHPGGEKEVMRIAGRDGTKLYMKTHSWVNYENMLRGCLVGVLVKEGYHEVKGGPKVGEGMEDMD